MEHATVSLSTVFAILGALLSVAAGAYGIILRFAFTTYEKNIEKRFDDLEEASEADEKRLETDVAKLTESKHELEKTCIRLEGQVKLLERDHSRASEDIKSIRDEMVTKNEWEPRMNTVEKTLQTILQEVRRSPGRYSGTSGSMGAVRGYVPPTSDPPKGQNR